MKIVHRDNQGFLVTLEQCYLYFLVELFIVGSRRIGLLDKISKLSVIIPSVILHYPRSITVTANVAYLHHGV